MAMNDDVFLPAHDVAKLVAKKSIPKRLKVSMKGTVTSLSRMMTLNSKSLFMLEVDSCVPILVKDFQLDWHPFLEPGGTYLFHSMIITTVEKGISEPQAVIFAWNDSYLTKINSDNNIITVSLDHWLLVKGLTADFPDQSDNEKNCLQDHNLDNCVNYEGLVTSVEDAKDGFYTLDNSIRLYCHHADLVVNCEVYIFNAHLIKVKGKKTATGLIAFFKKYHLSLREMLRTVKVRNSLLSLQRSNEATSLVVKRLLSVWKATKRWYRFLDEFIHHDSICPHSKQNTNGCMIPQILSLSAAKDEPGTKCQMSLPKINGSSKENFSADYLFFHRDNHEMLAGTITAGKKGQLYFCDGTEALPLLILENPENSPSSREKSQCSTVENVYPSCSKLKDIPAAAYAPHFCSEVCVNGMKFGENLPCSQFDVNIVNKVLFVREFHIVTEKHWAHHDERSERILVYLAFCLQNCLLVDEVDPLRNETVSQRDYCASTRKKSKLSSGHEKRSTCHIFVENKLQLRASNFTDSDNLEFEIVGHILEEDDVAKSHQPYILNARKFSHGNLMKANAERERDLNNSSQHVFSKFLKIPLESKMTHCSNSLPHSAPASVIFSGIASNWYHFTHVGSLYILETAQDKLVPTFSNDHLRKAAQHCSVRSQIQAPEDVRLRRLVSSVPRMKNNPPVYSVRDILSERFSESVVSFQCQILNRYTSKPFFADRRERAGNLAFAMVDICLEVKGLPFDLAADAASLTVYVESPRNVYSLGLVPGSVVQFICLERKVSQSGNVYCRFTVASSVQMLTLCPLQHDPSLNNQEQNGKTLVLADLPQVLLSELWSMDPGVYSTGNSYGATGQKMYALDCHICMVFQLIIKTVCSLCRGAFKDGECQSKKCRKDAHPVQVVNAKILIDDGSGQAVVTFHDAKLVALLLTLTEEQWQDVCDGLSECSELCISKDSRVPPFPVVQLLCSLCSSSLVLRPCKMAVRRDSNSPCQQSVDEKTLDEFQIKEVKIGKTILHTWSLPLMSLKCFAFEEIL